MKKPRPPSPTPARRTASPELLEPPRRLACVAPTPRTAPATTHPAFHHTAPETFRTSRTVFGAYPSLTIFTSMEADFRGRTRSPGVVMCWSPADAVAPGGSEKTLICCLVPWNTE